MAMDKELFLAQAKLFRKYGETMNHLQQMEGGLEVLIELLGAVTDREVRSSANEPVAVEDLEELLHAAGLKDTQLADTVQQARDDHRELAWRFFRDHGDALDSRPLVERVTRLLEDIQSRVTQANYAVFDTVHLLLNRHGTMLKLDDMTSQTGALQQSTRRQTSAEKDDNIIPLHPGDGES